MTVSTTDNKVNFAGDDIVLSFPFTFKTLDSGDIEVYIDDVLQGAGFTVNLNADQEASPGGTVDFSVAPATGETVTILRDLDLTQAVDYQPLDAFPAETHETALDRLTMITQQLKESVTRAIKAAVSVDTEFFLPAPEANKYLKWNATADDFENSTLDEAGLVAAQVAAAASAAAALVSENNAATSESNAATSEANAATSEANAATSEANAAASAAAAGASTPFFPYVTPAPSNTTVNVAAGYYVNSSGVITARAEETGIFLGTPAVDPRIDRVSLNPSTGNYTLSIGAEAPSPSAPALPAGNIPIMLVNRPSVGVSTIEPEDVIDNRLILDKLPQTRGLRKWASNNITFNHNVPKAMSFNQTSFDTEGLGTSSNFVVPAGITRARVTARMQFQTAGDYSASACYLRLEFPSAVPTDDTLEARYPFHVDFEAGTPVGLLDTGVFSVTPGDDFELFVNQSNTATASRQSITDNCFIAIEWLP